MVIENPLPPFFDWLVPALFWWLLVAGSFAAFALVAAVIATIVQRGPTAAAERVYLVASQGFFDLVRISPRRVLALAWLAFWESMRGRVFVALAVYLAILLFTPWFLNPEGDSPDTAKLYLTFVLGWSGFLTLLLALFLSVFSLPTDIAKRTIYTIVTKPVRQSEIVLGRIVGFTAVGTALLACMAVCSYIFVERVLTHSHEVEEASLKPVTPAAGVENPVVFEGRTSLVEGHRHRVSIFQDGTGETDVAHGHWHKITTVETAGKKTYQVGPPMDRLTARVPVYGKLHYRDSKGKDTDKADNVGNEWTYRQYVEGATGAAAVWRFEGIRPEQFPDGFPLQMTLSVFRTHKGDVSKPVLGGVSLRNPVSKTESSEMNFASKEFSIYEHKVPLSLRNIKEQKIDLFQDLVDPGTGAVEVIVRCVEPGQYFGAAQADLYIKAAEASFLPNFIKGYLGIWLQMVLIISVGVMFSTFLNGPVSMIATMFTLLCGLLARPIAEMFAINPDEGRILGGGPLESAYRIAMHSPMTTELDPGVGANVVQGLDSIAVVILRGVLSLTPDLSFFNTSNWVAFGFDIPLNDLLIHFLTALAYVVPWCVAGYFFLKLREVAK